MKPVSRQMAGVLALAVCAACGRTSPYGDSLVNGDQIEPHSPLSNGGATKDSDGDTGRGPEVLVREDSIETTGQGTTGSFGEGAVASSDERATETSNEGSVTDAGESSLEDSGADSDTEAKPNADMDGGMSPATVGENPDAGAEPDAGASTQAAPDAGTDTAPEMCRGAVVQTCGVDSNGQASCDCDNGLSGPECNQLWQALDPPPFILGTSFDAQSNAWFCTGLGLVYWNLNGTPEDTSDDAWQLVDTERSCTRSVNIDSDNRVWTGSGSSIHRLDHNGTPLDPSDDEWHSYTFDTFWRSQNYLARFYVDRQDRAWLLQRNTSGIKVLPDIALFGAGEIPWISMFTTHRLTDAASDANGVWLASESGVFYVDLGDDFSDASDDEWKDFSATPALADKHVDTIVVDSTGGKWFNTDVGVVHLDDGNDPFDESQHTWTPWSQAVGEASGMVMAVSDDGAQWLKTPWGAALRVNEQGATDDNPTQYNPAATSLFDSHTYRPSVSSVALDPQERVWLILAGVLYHFDDGQTPTDISDDVWTHVGRPRSNATLGSVYSDPGGGAWVKAEVPQTFNGACDQSVYYVDLGDARDAFDDIWVQYFVQDEMGPCWALHGIDVKGNHWNTSDDNFDQQPAQHIVMNVGGTPRDESDDIRTFYSADDSGIPSSRFTGFDPSGGLWFEDGYLDYGDAIESTTDDVWVTLDSYRPQTVAVDAAGKRWFGYSSDARRNVGIGGALRFFDDGGTLANTDDDTWVDFSPADGLPFYEPGATFFNISDVQIDARNLKWLVNGDSLNATAPNLCTLDDNHTPLDKCDDTWTVYMPNPELGNPRIYQIAMDSHSDLWLATASGLRYLHVVR